MAWIFNEHLIKMIQKNRKRIEEVAAVIPDPSEATDGQVIVVDNGEYAIGDIPTELPEASSSDEGKILSVDSNGDYVLATNPSDLPAVTSSDAGKIISVDANGDYELSDFVNGKLYTSSDTIDADNLPYGGCWIPSSATTTNLPATGSFFVITTNGGGTRSQFAISTGGNLYYRLRYSGSWHDWYYVTGTQVTP